MNADLDVIEAVKLTLAAIDKLVEHALRSSGSVEAQDAARLTQRARHRIDALVAREIAEAR